MDGPGCVMCGCTNDDCRHCIERTGRACYFVTADLCSACLCYPICPVETASPEAWKTAVNVAAIALALARQVAPLGIWADAATIDQAGCRHVLHRGAMRGYLPDPEICEKFVRGVDAWLDQVNQSER